MVPDPPSEEEAVMAFTKVAGPVGHVRHAAIQGLFKANDPAKLARSEWFQEDGVWW